MFEEGESALFSSPLFTGTVLHGWFCYSRSVSYSTRRPTLAISGGQMHPDTLWTVHSIEIWS